MTEANESCLGTQVSRHTITQDQEEWVKSRLKTAIRMALSVKEDRYAQADDALYQSAIEGIVNGAAWEIVRTLDLECALVNIRHPYPVDMDKYKNTYPNA